MTIEAVRDAVDGAAPASAADADDLGPRDFGRLAGEGYSLRLDYIGVTFELTRPRRDRHELWGQLRVTFDGAGARTHNGALSVADFNVSSARARVERAKQLALAARTKDGLDWTGLVEEFCQRVLDADAIGEPAVLLADLPRPSLDNRFVTIDGLHIPTGQVSCAFGDGDSAKTFTFATYIAGRLAGARLRVGVVDSEMSQTEHRLRLEQVWGDALPPLVYVRQTKPLIHEVDHLQSVVRAHDLNFLIHDSIVPGCAGPPESAEVVSDYLRALRQIGPDLGNLLIGHIPKNGDNDQKPFGSTFWHNECKATWFVKREHDGATPDSLRVGIFPRKSNLRAAGRPIAYRIDFSGPTEFQRAQFTTIDPESSPDLAMSLSVKHRMFYALRDHGQAMTAADLASEIAARVDTVTRTARNNRNRFVVLPGGRIGLGVTGGGS